MTHEEDLAREAFERERDREMDKELLARQVGKGNPNKGKSLADILDEMDSPNLGEAQTPPSGTPETQP